jgi:hypothetical protein
LIAGSGKKKDNQTTPSLDSEFKSNFDSPKNSNMLTRSPNDDTPVTAYSKKKYDGEKIILKNKQGIFKGNDRKQPIRTKKPISKFKPLKLKGQTSTIDVVCEPLQPDTVDPITELREMVQELKSDLDHERTMRQGLEKRVSELEQQKCEPNS